MAQLIAGKRTDERASPTRPAPRQALRAARFADAGPLLEARSLIKPELVWQIEAGLRQTGAEVSARDGS
jgi:hypothetical protein